MKLLHTSVIGLAAVFAATGCGAAADATATQLVVVGQGGGYDEAHKKAAKAFEEEHGVEITFQPGANTNGLVLARGGDVDLLLSQPLISFQGEKEGLWAEITPDNAPNTADLYEKAQLSPTTKVHDFGAYVLAYDPKQVSEPKTWESLWDKEYCEKITMPDFTNPVIILTTLMAEENGGSLQNMDPGFAKMEELAPCVHTWWESNDQVDQLFRSGEAAVGITTSARALESQQNGLEIEYTMPEPGALAMMTTANVVEDSPNRDLALEYLDHMMSPEAQKVFAESMPYMPSNPATYDQLEPASRDAIGFGPDDLDRFVAPDYEYVEGVIKDWQQEWNTRIHG
ncbi:polyamine ABC transporter substrate-binding protein [Brevibacterium sp.]|uniref:ABC transporter substrate-binding protein n=1 Tax=Brevibacterium sp. TaxID=1701 RepID=UPI002810E467|nr:polyamine ABC transporter substrate-binding protein [Brevibacterium sp.]